MALIAPILSRWIRMGPRYCSLCALDLGSLYLSCLNCANCPTGASTAVFAIWREAAAVRVDKSGKITSVNAPSLVRYAQGCDKSRRWIRYVPFASTVDVFVDRNSGYADSSYFDFRFWSNSTYLVPKECSLNAHPVAIWDGSEPP